MNLNLEGGRNEGVAIVCGSGTLAGGAFAARLRNAGWLVITVDPPGGTSHAAAAHAIQGEIWTAAFWDRLRGELQAGDIRPAIFVHAVSGFEHGDSQLGPPGDDALARIVLSADLGCTALMPLMPRGRGAVVVLASVLAGWDTRESAGGFGASQAGLLALVRALALRGGPGGIRVNAVGMGVVADPHRGDDAISPEMRARIPLGRPAAPDDIGDAVEFLLSPDARHITGTTLAVDGGQSLQSWSNAPRAGGYSPPPPRGARCLPAAHRVRGGAVLITGAGGGLGSAAARRFAAEGANLALLDRDGSAAARLADELILQGRDALALEVDVSDERALAAAFARAEAHFGTLEVIFNNAGVGGDDLALAETPAERWDKVMAVNLRGVFLGCKYGVPALRRAGGGAIVTMGSSTGRHDTITGGAAYMASKAAVEAMTKSLALQVAPFGIRANTVCPGIIETPLSFRQQERGDRDEFFAGFAARIPLGRVGQPDDVAAAVVFLASDQARHITGASLLIDGGQTLRRWISAPDLTESGHRSTGKGVSP